MARSLAQTGDPGDALARVLRAIGESLDWRMGAVWEPSPDRPEALSCVETWSAAGAAGTNSRRPAGTPRWPRAKGCRHACGAAASPPGSPSPADDNFPRAASARQAGLHAAFCFPIRSARGVLGVIEFFTGDRAHSTGS